MRYEVGDTWVDATIKFEQGDRVVVGMQASAAFALIVGQTGTIRSRGRAPWVEFDEPVVDPDDPGKLGIHGRKGYMRCMYQNDLVLLERAR